MQMRLLVVCLALARIVFGTSSLRQKATPAVPDKHARAITHGQFQLEKSSTEPELQDEKTYKEDFVKDSPHEEKKPKKEANLKEEKKEKPKNAATSVSSSIFSCALG